MFTNEQNKKTLIHSMIILAASLGLGFLFASLLPVGNFWKGVFEASLLICIIGLVLYWVWRAAGRDRSLGWMILLAFILRFALGVFLAWGLPRFGYPERPQQAGFVFEDPFRREENAWNLANSDAPLTDAFRDVYESDQYGGMLALSALIYRVLSPDAYRPALISIIAAGAMALSVPILTSALKGNFTKRTVLWAGWILALYPDGILLGSAQMREPFFILFLTLIIWSVVQLLDRKRVKLSILVLTLALLSLFMFSYRVGLPIMAALLLWIWVELSSQLNRSWKKTTGWVLIIFAGISSLWFMREWVSDVLHWDTLQTVRRSGMVQFILDTLPDWADFPFVLIYGFFQPVLPAAIAAPAPWIWRSLGIFRGLGWYALLPLLAYAVVRVWQLEPSRKRRWLIFLALLVWAWVFIASARAGGDQWDNPRYRTILLPWMALVGGWAIQFAIKTRDAWFTRILIIEGLLLMVITGWYLGRYNPALPRFGFGLMVAIILALSGLVIGVGWLHDSRRMGKIGAAAADEALDSEG
jgi:hypothetical protein